MFRERVKSILTIFVLHVHFVGFFCKISNHVMLFCIDHAWIVFIQILPNAFPGDHIVIELSRREYGLHLHIRNAHITVIENDEI